MFQTNELLPEIFKNITEIHAMASIDSYQTPSFTRMALHLGSNLDTLPSSTNVFDKSKPLRSSHQSNSESRNIFTTPSTLRLAQHLGRNSESNPCRITSPQHTERNRDTPDQNMPPGTVMLERHLGNLPNRPGQSGHLNTVSRQSATPTNAASTDNLAMQSQFETRNGSFSRRRRSSNRQPHLASFEFESYTRDRLSNSWFRPAPQENSRGAVCIQNNGPSSIDDRNQFSDRQDCQSLVSPPPYESLFLNEEIYNDYLVTSENSSAANLHSSLVSAPSENNETNATVRENSEEGVSQSESNDTVSSGQVRLSQHLGSAPRRESFWETLERARLTGQTVNHFGTETQESNEGTGDERFSENVSSVRSDESDASTNAGEIEERPIEPPSYSDLKDTWENINMSEAEIEIYEEEQRRANQNMTSPFYLMAMHYSYP